MPSDNPTPLTDAFATPIRGLGTGYYQALDHARRIETVMHKLADALDKLYNDHCESNSTRAEIALAEYQTLMNEAKEKE